MPWHFLYFLPEPHGQGSLRPTFGWSLTTVLILPSSSPPGAAPRFGPVNRNEPGRLGGRLSCTLSGVPCSETICKFNNDRIVVVSMRSSISWNRSKLCFLYSTSGSFCP